jgi:hypothetical protein
MNSESAAQKSASWFKQFGAAIIAANTNQHVNS